MKKISKIGWLTDPHFDFLKKGEFIGFLDHLARQELDMLLISGDMSYSRSLPWILDEMAVRLPMAVWYVLGNHDYYGASIAHVRFLLQRRITTPCHPGWLTSSGIVELGDDVALMGHDGWADGRYGDYANSTVMLSDYKYISDFVGLDGQGREGLLHRLGDDAALQVRENLQTALAGYRHIIFLTHVPPFRESCWYDGKISDDNYLPHFACKAVGDVLLEAMAKHPHSRLTVLCGHTHGSGIARPLPNILVLTGGADYGKPALQRVFSLAELRGWEGALLS